MPDQESSFGKIRVINLGKTISENEISNNQREILGGKADGLLTIRDVIKKINLDSFPDITIDIPPDDSDLYDGF